MKNQKNTNYINGPLDLKNIFNNFRIHSINELENIIEPIQMLKNSSNLQWHECYRGQGFNKWRLEPWLTREIKDESTLIKMEIELHEKFKQLHNSEFDEHISSRKTSGFNTKFEVDWFELFQMQHLGFMTRLLDWSIDWKTALYFSVSNSRYDGIDGQFWVFFQPEEFTHNFMEYMLKAPPRYLNINPYELQDTMIINPPFYPKDGDKKVLGENRRLVQSGRFLIQPHKDSATPLEAQININNCLIKIIIDGVSKVRLRKALNDIGYTKERIYARQTDDLTKKIQKINEEVLNKYKL
ncbi:MAG: FRG domain-containing protein [Saprospiraceae bacterium]|nr:FRG domain-containing protein [Saprospiraceae bacterium]